MEVRDIFSKNFNANIQINIFLHFQFFITLSFIMTMLINYIVFNDLKFKIN